MRNASGLVLLAWICTACSSEPPEPIATDIAQHRAEITRFQDARVAEIGAPDSWLSLIALHFLPEGETMLGSDAANDVVFPEGKAQAVVGRIVRDGASVRFLAEAGVGVTMGIDSTLSLSAGSGAFPLDVSGDPLITDEALGDAGPGKSIVFRHGPLNWVLMTVGDEFALRVRDNESPAYGDFDGIDRFAIDAEWRVTARWVGHDKTVLVPNILGTSSEAQSPAYLEFWLEGERYTLDVTGEPGSARFMMVFADGTSGRDTYGGGRYLWFSAPDEKGRVILDFNLAYNPPCVWSGHAACPLPTRDNRLTVAIVAGERDWTH